MKFVVLVLLLISCGVSAFVTKSGYPQRSVLKMMRSSPILNEVFGSNDNNNNGPVTSLTPSAPIESVKKNAVPVFAAAAAMLLPLLTMSVTAVNAASGDAAPVVEKVALGPPPTDFTLKNDYYSDCQQVINHMRYAVQLEKGNPLLADIATKTKAEMNEFVSFYRRFQGINGKQSFSLLYTSINVLAGHYTSYGAKFPVPEKRRKRLLQEFNDIEKNLRKKR